MARMRMCDADAPRRNLVRDVLEREGYDGVDAANASEGLPPSQTAPTDLARRDIALALPLDMNAVSTRFHGAKGPCLALGHGSYSLTRMPYTALDDWMFR